MHTVTQPHGADGAPSRAPAAPVARVAVAGATGYTGQELLRLLSRHPAVALTAAMSSGQAAGSSRPLPGLARLWDGTIVPVAPQTLAREADVVFLALPDAAAARLAPALVDAGVRVIDLSGAFRLRDAALRARWYPETHDLPAGVGKTPSERTHFSEIHASLAAYGVFNHRHGAEIEEGVGRTVTFTPHLVPL